MGMMTILCTATYFQFMHFRRSAHSKVESCGCELYFGIFLLQRFLRQIHSDSDVFAIIVPVVFCEWDDDASCILQRKNQLSRSGCWVVTHAAGCTGVGVNPLRKYCTVRRGKQLTRLLNTGDMASEVISNTEPWDGIMHGESRPYHMYCVSVPGTQNREPSHRADRASSMPSQPRPQR